MEGEQVEGRVEDSSARRLQRSVGDIIGFVKVYSQGQVLPILRVETCFECWNTRRIGQVREGFHDRDSGEEQQSGESKDQVYESDSDRAK